VREKGKKLKKVSGIEIKGKEDDRLIMELVSGEYEFEITP
jgi:hypothetical protein